MPSIKTLIPLPGSERALRSGSKLIGPANPKDRVEVTMRLRSRNKKQVSADKIGGLLPLKRHYLSREEFAATYGAAPADVTKIKSFAAKNKLAVVSINPEQRNVILSGTVKAVSDAFRVKLMQYEHSDGNYRGRIGRIHLSAALVPIVEGVFGLDNRRMAKPHIVTTDRSAASPAARASTYTALQVAQFYDYPAGLDGSGECIGILEFGGGYNSSDLTTYFSQLGIATPSVSSVSVDGVSNSPGDPQSDPEVALDIEVAGTIAPGARIVVYFAPFTEQGWVDALTTAIHDNVNNPSVISISWGFAEGEPVQGFEWTPQTTQAVNQTLQAAAAMGVSVCVASGDNGSSDGINDGHAHVDFPASSPYSLGCGGTKLTTANNKIRSEVVWNQDGSGGGGGISAMNPLPSWQAGIVPPSVNPGDQVGRGVPDVCGDADPATGYQIFYDGQPNIVGGTSAVAPLWAGLLARINQKLGTPVGYFNPLLYSSLGNSSSFHDIVKGNNDTTGQVGGYSAGKGWDACTGWGSPDGANLLQALSAQGGS
ncbi:MAG TPA: S53 family peptidase [Candidatus Baltobacteraceae bacterium]|nr:S53 family peptidase [Candidatus Baltobacteraceae bacterium]